MFQIKPLTGRDLHIITIFFGFSSAIAQVLLIRELLTIFRGNEFTIGIIFSAWFLGIFLGARFNPEAERTILEKRIYISLLLFPLILLLVIYLSHFIPIIFIRTVGTFYYITTEFILSIFLSIPVSIFIGFFFPPIVSLVSGKEGQGSGGNIYFIESIGAFVGGVVFSFILVDNQNPLGIISILLFISMLFFFRRNFNRRFILILLIPLGIFFFSEDIEKKFFEYIWNRTHSGSLLSYKRTRYQMVSLEERDGQYSIYGDGIFYYSLPDQYESRAIFHLIQSLRHKKNERVMIVGGGPGSLIYNLLKTDISSLYYFETDPELWGMVDRYRKIFYKDNEDNQRFKVILQDIKYFLIHSLEKFDIILCFFPPPENLMLNRFYTEDFYSLCKDHLKSDGIFITSIHGFSNYMSKELKRSIASIYKGFLGNFLYFLETSGETIYLIGAKKKGIIPINYNLLINGYRERYSGLNNINLEREIIDNFDPEELRMLFERTQIEYYRSQITPLISEIKGNIDFKPNAYWNYLLLSTFQEKSIFSKMFHKSRLFLVFAILLTLIVFFNFKKKYSTLHFKGCFYMFISGFVSISICIILIILYQNFYGIVYYRIALINALFMLGLAMGSFIANRKKNGSLASRFLMLIMILLLIILYTNYNIECLFWLAIFLLSLVCGSIFPTIFRKISKDKYHITSSILDSTDHFGSIMGSLITVTFLIPEFGLTGTVYFNIMLLVLTMGILFFFRFNGSPKIS